MDVAFQLDGLVAHHHEVNDVIALYRAAGYASHQVELKYMDPDPLPQILCMIVGSIGTRGRPIARRLITMFLLRVQYQPILK